MAASTVIRNRRIPPVPTLVACAGQPRGPGPRFARRGVAGGLAGMLSLALVGCGSDTAAPPARSAAQLYWALELNQHAVMLALPPSQYDTVQLIATPRTGAGTPLATMGTVSYRSLDTLVTVSSTGLVTARHVTTQPVRVVASLQDPQQRVTHADTAYITVTAGAAQAVDTFSMQPVSGDSAKRALGIQEYTNSFDWSVRALDGQGAPVPLLVHYTSSRPLIAAIDPQTGQVTTHDTGNVVFTAQSLAYGQVLRDSVQFRVGYMLQNYLVLYLVAALGVLALATTAPKKLVLGVGATLMYCNIGRDPTNGNLPPFARPIDVVFDHPEAVDSASCVYQGTAYVPPTGSGNIAPFGGDTLDRSVDVACRGFHVPGVYHYHSTLFPSDTYEIDIRSDPQ